MQYARQDLRTQARIAADQDNSTFPTDAAYNGIIDRAADQVWRRMVAVGWKPLTQTQNIDASTGANSYSLSFDVATINLIYPVASISSGVPTGPALRRLKVEELVPLSFSSNNVSPATYYDFQGGYLSGFGAPQLKLSFFPPQTSGFYRVILTPQFSGFASDSDLWLGPEGSGELIILTAAIEGALKEGDPGTMVGLLQKRLDDRFREVVEFGGFLVPDPQTVRDVRQSTPWLQGDFFAREVL